MMPSDQYMHFNYIDKTVPRFIIFVFRIVFFNEISEYSSYAYGCWVTYNTVLRGTVVKTELFSQIITHCSSGGICWLKWHKSFYNSSMNHLKFIFGGESQHMCFGFGYFEKFQGNRA